MMIEAKIGVNICDVHLFIFWVYVIHHIYANMNTGLPAPADVSGRRRGGSKMRQSHIYFERVEVTLYLGDVSELVSGGKSQSKYMICISSIPYTGCDHIRISKHTNRDRGPEAAGLGLPRYQQADKPHVACSSRRHDNIQVAAAAGSGSSSKYLIMIFLFFLGHGEWNI